MENIKGVIRFAKVKLDAIIPSKRHEDGCYDIYSNFEDDEIIIKSGQIKFIPTGIASSFDPRYRFNCKRERGSTGKIGLEVLSGQIDSGYRGEWFVCLVNPTSHDIIISKMVEETKFLCRTDGSIVEVYYPYSKAICQAALEFVPVVDIEEVAYEELKLILSERGMGKVGSSGK